MFQSVSVCMFQCTSPFVCVCACVCLYLNFVPDFLKAMSLTIDILWCNQMCMSPTTTFCHLSNTVMYCFTYWMAMYSLFVVGFLLVDLALQTKNKKVRLQWLNSKLQPGFKKHDDLHWKYIRGKHCSRDVLYILYFWIVLQVRDCSD